MAQRKISELTSTTKLNDDNIIPLVQDGVTKHIRYGDMKSPMVKEVEANVEDYVDEKMTKKANYGFTTMVDLGFANKSYVSVRTFWNKLHSWYGSQGLIQFDWNDAKAAFLGVSGNSIYITGGTLIYSCDGTSGAWKTFSAIYYSGWSDEVYRIRCSIGADTTTDSWSMDKLAHNADILNIRSNLENVSEKLNYTQNHYPNAAKIIGKWHDGRNIMRLVVLPNNIDIPNADGYKIDFLNHLALRSKVGIILSAKLCNGDGPLYNLLPRLHDDSVNGDRYIFEPDGFPLLPDMKNNGTIECAIVEYVQK